MVGSIVIAIGAAALGSWFADAGLLIPLAVAGAALPLPLHAWWRAYHHGRNQRATSEALIQTLLEVIPEPAYLKDAQGRYLMVNTAFTRQRQQSPEQILGRTAFELAPDEDTARFVQAEDEAVLAGQIVYNEDLTRNAYSGDECLRLISKRSSLWLDGQRVIVGASFDISQVRHTETRLQQALDRQTEIAINTVNFVQRLLNVIPEPVYIKDAQGHYVFINEAFARQRNQTASEILGRTATELAPDGATAALVAHEDAEVLSGHSIHKEDQKPHPVTDDIIHRIVTKGACLDAEGRPVIIGANFDITDLRRAQADLQEALARERE
ncbi:MAG: hypothetical protein CGU29_06360 [Candidatus Dactylopiibacterium carminicum]|uniref:PAS domain-containing protein n=1 Tax=Candidatus Dactylopiibacterium carminicum TaxID=857335 RepID=A0A272EUS3_9RHOO|nr:PAS domain-containing protein [Candidatus Dactylopiibacterium carminicum]KAF7600319.1 hypothetical protein BGI27_02765 [Candidatus Dactylopiibacterium carminicum]PAS93853.1 MAG: hypothetical protein CGU29_06360 [Candidatus Dactylopiibacterium carminicum]PAT00321.1 MAG: hypothetical protein BSR46_02785 [Candidatus Dactylopiibacterium carminicum]